MIFDYPGGVLPHERQTVERFERDVFPYTEKHGPRIGEMAMSGDEDAVMVIRYQRAFCEGDPGWREHNLGMLIEALKRVERKLQ